MNDELKAKIDVGFKPEAKDRRIINTAEDLLDWLHDPEVTANARLECLTLAYEVAFKQDIFSPTHWNKKTEEEQIETYKQIFELSDYNVRYIATGKSGL